MRLTVANNLNHPSVFAWSLVNEPAGSALRARRRSAAGSQTFIREGAAAARELDDTRLIAIDRQSRIGEPLSSPAYRYLDALGVNEYFGWYDSVPPGPARGPDDHGASSGPTSTTLHRANPALPLVITEYGAEASRHAARSTSAGTYEFQTQLHARPPADPQLEAATWPGRSPGRCATSGSSRAGRAARPLDYATSPWNNKSLIEETNVRKPVYFELRKRWRRTRPLG